MKTDILLNKDTNCIRLSSIVKAEARKATDTQVAKTIIVTTAFLTFAMFIVSILRFKNAAPWTDPFIAISSPASTLLVLIFILLICEEWTRGTAVITYTFVPQRNKVIVAKFIILLVFFLGTIITLYALSAIASIIASVIYSYSISWSEPIYSVVLLVLPLLVNMLFGFSMAIATQETTIALGLYFVVPPITVIASQLPVVGSYLKWFSLEHSSSLFIAGATGVSATQYICSILIWIVVPCIIGSFRMKRDLN